MLQTKTQPQTQQPPQVLNNHFLTLTSNKVRITNLNRHWVPPPLSHVITHFHPSGMLNLLKVTLASLPMRKPPKTHPSRTNHPAYEEETASPSSKGIETNDYQTTLNVNLKVTST